MVANTAIVMGTILALFGAEERVYTVDRDVVYVEPEGKELRATLYLPKATQEARPAIVLIHGGGWFFGGRRQQAWYCRAFAKRGYVVMAIEYRKMFGHPFPDCVYDCKAAVRWLRRNADKYRVDPDAIGAFGASAGGHLAGMLATTSAEDGFEGDSGHDISSRIGAAVILYGAVDLSAYREKGGLATRYLARFVGARSKEERPAALERASPVTYVKPSACPVLLVHGAGDSLVHLEQARRFHDRLRAAGVPTRLIVVANHGHGFDYIHWRQRRRLFEEMVAFLEVHLGGPPAASTG